MNDGGTGPRDWQDCGMGWGGMKWAQRVGMGQSFGGNGEEVNIYSNAEGSCRRVESGRKQDFINAAGLFSKYHDDSSIHSQCVITCNSMCTSYDVNTPSVVGN